jgi:isopenicillin N synthase-like dioxygenase
MIKDPRVDE